MARISRTQWAAVVGALSFCSLLAYTSQAQDPAQHGGAARATPQFVGNEACAECHAREMTKHKGSRHDLTLHEGDVRKLGALTPPSGPIPGTAYSISRKGNQLLFGLSNAPAAAKPVQLAFGSGKTGMTYVVVEPDNRQVEFRMSRIPSSKSWYITPGQESRADLDHGLVHSFDMTKRCIGCHAISVPEDTKTIARKMFGVGCESCHGPGSEHIAAAHIKGNLDLKIERMSRWTPHQINQLCAKCHRSQDDVSLITRDASSTQRFQPYGLELSPCFRKSGEKLSCAICHDSHANISHEQRTYERVCITCHQSPAARIAPDPRVPPDAVHGKRPCPVNPREKCVGCHMPATQIFPGSKLPVKMADHMIWAYGKSRARRN